MTLTPFPLGRLRALIARTIALAACLAAFQAQAQTLPVQQLRAGMHLIQAEIADSDATRERGLMFRENLPPNHGMLFLFDDMGSQCMWMRNTLIPLSVAFIADDGTIMNIEEMKAKTDDSHCAVKPVRFALEMDSQWFTKHGLKAGSKIDGITTR